MANVMVNVIKVLKNSMFMTVVAIVAIVAIVAMLQLLQLLQYNQLIVFQHLNYVYHYDCHIFSMQHIYIVLYCMPNFAFTLIFNILDIEVHYDCHVFTVQGVYSGQNFYIYHTVSYRIHP